MALPSHRATSETTPLSAAGDGKPEEDRQLVRSPPGRTSILCRLASVARDRWSTSHWTAAATPSPARAPGNPPVQAPSAHPVSAAAPPSTLAFASAS